jgi:hypothetical protein
MSLWQDLYVHFFGENRLEAEFDRFKESFEELIRREESSLKKLGITPPKLRRSVSYTASKTKSSMGDARLLVKVTPPEFEIPQHRQFFIRSDKLVLTLFKDLEAADQAYLWWGLSNIVNQKYGGVWTNRDPFAFYLKLDKAMNRELYWSKSEDFTKAAESGILTDELKRLCGSLKAEKGLHEKEASELHLRVEVYNDLTGNRFSGEWGKRESHFKKERSAAQAMPEDLLLTEPVPNPWSNLSYSCLTIVPSAGEIKPAMMIEFFNSLREDLTHFISFELIRENGTINFRLEFPRKYKSKILTQLALYFPDFAWRDAEATNLSGKFINHWLRKDWVYTSIRRLREFQLDPYAQLASLFETAAKEEQLCYQIMFAPLPDQMAAKLKWRLGEDYQKNLSKKLPLWVVSINAGSGTDMETAGMLAKTIGAYLNQPERVVSPPYTYTINNGGHFPNLFPAFTSLCDTEELATLAHFPITPLPQFRSLERSSLKNVTPPELYTAGETRIGTSQTAGSYGKGAQPVTLPESVRDRHLYIVGKSGTGKSTLMETVARRDIEAGRGVAVIDPHGDMIHHLMETMPEHRVSDCILFSPKHSPVSLEILKAENEHEIDLLTDDLITMFRRTSESWGDKMQAILQMAFQTLLRVPGSSFSDITTLLTDESYRRRILDKINHPQLSSFWEQRYDMRQAEPILIRMDRLTTSSTLRAVLTQNKNSLNFYDVVTESKIFLADLSKGFLGESTSHLLGSIIVSQVQLAAMRQAHIPAEQRIPFSLFVDEVQNFTTSAFSTILSEARKQKLRLTIAHQFVSQLPQELQKAVFGNVGTLVFFAMSPDDLGAARHELGTFDPSDVANLAKYHALCRPVTAARDTFSFVTDPPPPPRADARRLIQSVIEQTLNEYSVVAAYTPTSSLVAAQPAPALTSNGQESQPSQTQSNLTVLDQRCPKRAEPLVFSTNTDKILYFLRQAEYLSQPQIIALTGLQPSNASTALKKLVDTGQIKTLDDRRPKIYFIGRNCNPTTHNLLVRDLFVKIYNSNYAIQSVKFNGQLADLNPDLTVEFVAEGEIGSSTTPLLCYFEVDRGTEGVAELVKKAERYSMISPLARVGFVFERETDLQSARKTIQFPFVYYGTLDSFRSLEDEAFNTSSASESPDTKLPFFGS